MPIPTTTVTMNRKSLRVVAREKIRDAVFDGTFAPGERLLDGELQEWLGISRTPLREALNDLARIGLIEMAAQKYTRVAIPKPDDRVLILQTVGALVGGVVRVTTDALSPEQRTAILSSLDATLRTVEARDAQKHGTTGWAMIDLFLDACPNPYLVQATRDTVDALAYQLAITRTEDSTNWNALDTGYPHLRTALTAKDPVAAELAIETVFQL